LLQTPTSALLAERLIDDAGFQPLYVGDLSAAATLEAHIAFTMLLAGGEVGPYFYRFATTDL
jgi:predicted dinucleotide-binding enzyme